MKWKVGTTLINIGPKTTLKYPLTMDNSITEHSIILSTWLKKIWTCIAVDIRTKLLHFKSTVLLTATYSCETSTGTMSKCLDVFQQRCLRRILKISFTDPIKREEILCLANMPHFQDIVAER